jgi:predicted O-methyltransferase YrrM
MNRGSRRVSRNDDRESEASEAARARENLSAAGLSDLVEVREGIALENVGA